MTSPASHRRTSTNPEYFRPVPDGAIPIQRRPETGVHRAAASPGRGRMAAGVALVLLAAVGAAWLLLGSSGPGAVDDADAAARAELLPLDGDAPRLTGLVPAGTFDVGHEVEAGLYRTAGTSALGVPGGCRWEVIGGGVGPLVTGGAGTGPMIVELRPGAGNFTSTGCQDWVRLR